MKTKKSLLWNTGNFIVRIIKAIVSGIPGKKMVFKPQTKTNVENKHGNFKVDVEKHYHRPVSRPATEKQTLPKGKKKVGVAH